MKAGINERELSRRDFVLKSALGGALLVFGDLGVLRLAAAEERGKREYMMIVADYSRCTGCRTCETACSAFNHKRTLGGDELPGLGNPYLSNIRVFSYNPDVDVPSTCTMCPDAPCIEACPVEPDGKTGRKAIYRDGKTLAIRNDANRCIGCGSCSENCRAGVIVQNSDTGKPERMCTLCDGDPQCVRYCPFGALTYVTVDTEMEFYGWKPDKIAEALIRKWYVQEDKSFKQ